MTKGNTVSVMKELTHQYRMMNMWITIYEKLQVRYRVRVWFLQSSLLLASLLLCLTSFVDPKILLFSLITPDKSQMILGISSFAVFLIALIFLLNDWKEKTAIFGQALETLNRIQIECHEQLKLEITEESWDLKAKCLLYTSIINHLPKIPERNFHKLKAFHKRQMELGKMIDLYPGGSVWLLKVFTFFRANSHVLLRKPINCNNDEIDKKD